MHESTKSSVEEARAGGCPRNSAPGSQRHGQRGTGAAPTLRKAVTVFFIVPAEKAQRNLDDTANELTLSLGTG